MTKVNIEINGKKIQADSSAMVIEAADEAGVHIPRFCYHKKLSIAANCRMCLIEVEKAAKPLPACATPVTDGMKVFTRSPKAIAAQKGVLEFLLVNHPLDCPICDQGGECELQDISVGFGNDTSVFKENKRVVKDKNLGSLIATDMTRCIHCTRCVRFGDEIAGIRELGATGRGEHMEIGTYIEAAVGSEMSGNVIDLCPVGALTSKPFRFSARAWEMTQHESIAPHDCVGSNVFVHVRNNEVMRVVPKDNEQINETWISDRDRFSYEGLHSDERLTEPMIKIDGKWQVTDWNTALENVLQKVTGIVDKDGADQLGCLVSPSATIEEMYLAQKLLRGVGSNNIDHRLRQLDFSDQDLAPVSPWLGQNIQDLETLNAALLIGSNVRKDQPIASHRLRNAALNGASIMFVNPVDYEFNFPVKAKVIASPHTMASELAGIAKAIIELTGGQVPQGFESLVSGINVTETQRSIAENLNKAKNASVLLGNYAHGHPAYATLRALAGLIAQYSNGHLGYLTDGANAAGAWLAGAVPHRTAGGERSRSAGLNSQEMLQKPRKAYFLLGLEPELDCSNAPLAGKAMENAEVVVALSAFKNASMEASCDVLLPVSPFTETSGTFVNTEGRWQSFNGVTAPLGEARPAWKVLRVLGNLFDVDGFDYISSDEVLEEVKLKTTTVVQDNSLEWRCPETLSVKPEDMMRIAEVPMYAVDALVRRASSLQQTKDANGVAIRVNSNLAQRLGLYEGSQAKARQGNFEVTLPIVIDERVADNSVLIQAAAQSSAGLKCDFEPLSLHQA